MATIKLEIAPPAAASARQLSFLVKLRPLPDADDTAPQRKLRTLTVAAGHAVPVDLEPGRWLVELITPVGAVVSEDVIVEVDSIYDMKFDLAAPYGTTALRQQRRLKMQPPGPEKPVYKQFLGAAVTFARRFVEDHFHANDESRGSMSTPTVVIMRSSVVHAVPTDDPCHLWTQLAAGWTATIPGLEGTAVERPVVQHRGDHHWMAILSGTGMPLPPHERWFAIVQRNQRKRLHSLPMPWFLGPSSEARLDRLSIEVTEIGTDLDSEVILCDPSYSTMIEYMSSGPTAAAADVLRADPNLAQLAYHAENFLREKRASPLGACAAAYVLMNTSDLREEAPWHSWVSNLASWFPFIPDGAILQARLQLLKSRSAEEAQKALPSLHAALERGLPFYSLGIGWALEAMTFFKDDPIIRECRPKLETVAGRLDLSQVFTTMYAAE